MSVELGMAEMLSLLVSEVVQGIAAANLEQHDALRSVREALEIPDEDFAVRFVTDEEVLQAMNQTGAPGAATLARKQIVEQLSIRGIAAAENAAAPQLMEVLKGQLRKELAVKKRLELAEQASSQALPRVMIDSGTVRARVAIRAIREPPPKRPQIPVANVGAEPDEIVLRSTTQIIDRLARGGQQLPGLRLGVRSLTQAQTLSGGDGSAEIQINFKTL